LKELRNIEDGRVKKEKEEADARLDAERAARPPQSGAVRRRRGAKVRDEQDRVRRIEDEKEGRIREEQMRLQEAERFGARVEGEGTPPGKSAASRGPGPRASRSRP